MYLSFHSSLLHLHLWPSDVRSPDLFMEIDCNKSDSLLTTAASPARALREHSDAPNVIVPSEGHPCRLHTSLLGQPGLPGNRFSERHGSGRVAPSSLGQSAQSDHAPPGRHPHFGRAAGQLGQHAQSDLARPAGHPGAGQCAGHVEVLLRRQEDGRELPQLRLPALECALSPMLWDGCMPGFVMPWRNNMLCYLYYLTPSIAEDQLWGS